MYRNILRNSHFFQLGCSLYSTHNTASVQRENGLLLVCSMERFLPPAGGSSASSMVTCGEPTCPMKSALITAVHKCPCGRAMHGFCGRGIGEEGFGQQREFTDYQRSSREKAGTSSSPMEVDIEDGVDLERYLVPMA